MTAYENIPPEERNSVPNAPEKSGDSGMSDDEKIDAVAVRILKKYKPAFLELAK